MSAVVDVLAVLNLHTDECHRELRLLEQEIDADRVSNYGKEYADLKERYARANAACVAVAELIEADRRFDRASRAWFDAKYFPGQFSKPETQRLADEYEDAIASRAAALTRVGGAS